MKNHPLSFYALFFMVLMLIAKVSGILFKIVLAKAVTPYEYGLITFIVIALPNLFMKITNLCFPTMVSHSSKGRKYFRFSIAYAFFSLFFITMFILLFNESFFNFLNLPYDNQWINLFIAFMLVLFAKSLLYNISGLLRGARKYSDPMAIRVIPPLTRFLFVLILVYALDIKNFVSILLIAASAELIFLIFIAVKNREFIFNSLKQTTPLTKNMVLFGILILLVADIGAITEGIIKVIIMHSMGVELQAYFDVSLTLVSIIGFASMTLFFYMIPEATSESSSINGKKNKREHKDLYKSNELKDMTRALFAFLILCVIVICFYADLFVKLLFSEYYLPAADYVYILAVGFIALFIQQIVTFLHLSEISLTENREGIKKQFIFLIVTLILLMSFPFVAAAIVKKLGFLGAYVSTTLFWVLYAVITIIYFKDFSSIRVLLHRFQFLALASIVLIILNYFFNSLELSLIYNIIVICISMGVYIGLLFLTGYLNRKLITDTLNLVKKKI